MSSFVIGLDIGRNHVTASLVRLEELTIERDTFYIRSFEENAKQDPRLIVSTWIQCIDDLLRDFMEYYQEDEKIIGIACGISYPMDYEHGICCSQSSKFDGNDRFFGLNLRLLFQSGLRDLIRHGQYNQHPKYYTPPTSPRSSASSSKPQRNPKKFDQKCQIIITPPTPRPSFSFPIKLTISQVLQSPKLSVQKLTSYCGSLDGDHEKIISPHLIEITSPKLSLALDTSTLKLRSMIDQLSDIPISFYNDTFCFAVGEANNIYNKNYDRILLLTLGNTFASAFIDHGEILRNRQDIPPNGILNTENDCFSTYGLIKIYNKLLPHEIEISNGYSLALRAFNGDKNAMKAYHIFAHRLGKFLTPYIESFQPNLLLIGGGLAQAWYLIENELHQALQKFSSMEIYFSLSYEKSICLGAVQQQQQSLLFKSKPKILRQTDQNLLPVVKTRNLHQYDWYPCHEIPIGYIGIGHAQLNEKMFRFIRENNILLIDGFIGTDFDEFAEKFNRYYFQHKRNLPPLIFYDTSIFLRTKRIPKQESNSSSILEKLKKELIDLDRLTSIQKNLLYPCVIIGPGASFINESSPLIYVDLPKNEFYYRFPRQTSVSYLTSMRIFDKLKQELLPRMNFFVDGQRPKCPTWLDGDTFRQALAHISNQPIHIHPWFKTLNENLSKVSIDDELSSENGILLSDTNQHLVEFSWNILYNSQANRILGNDLHCRLVNGSNEFPICFRILDMANEDSLPDKETNFKGQLRRNRAYYVIQIKQNQTMLSPRCTRDNESRLLNTHDLFFIPNGLHHTISRNEILLEISTRSDLDDCRQSLNNNHEISQYDEQHPCQPKSMRSEQLSTPDFYIYDVQRLVIEANESVEIIRFTENRFHLCILVEGDAIEVGYNSIDNNQEKQIREYNSLETFLIPASIHQYRLRPRMKTQDKTGKPHQCVLLITYLK